jgi:hypothetical protein
MRTFFWPTWYRTTSGQAIGSKGMGGRKLIERLRVELKAISEWEKPTQLFRTQTELDAVVFRHLRVREIKTLLLKIAATK